MDKNKKLYIQLYLFSHDHMLGRFGMPGEINTITRAEEEESRGFSKYGIDYEQRAYARDILSNMFSSNLDLLIFDIGIDPNRKLDKRILGVSIWFYPDRSLRPYPRKLLELFGISTIRNPDEIYPSHPYEQLLKHGKILENDPYLVGYMWWNFEGTSMILNCSYSSGICALNIHFPIGEELLGKKSSKQSPDEQFPETDIQF